MPTQKRQVFGKTVPVGEKYCRPNKNVFVEPEYLKEQLTLVSQALAQEKKKTALLSELYERQEHAIFYFREQNVRREMVRIESEHKDRVTTTELNNVRKRLNEEKDQVDDLLEQLDDRDLELKKAISKLKKEEYARRELQLENSNLNLELLNLRIEFKALKCDTLKVVKEKETLEERLTQVSQILAEKGEVNAAVRKLIRNKNQITKEVEHKDNLTYKQRSAENDQVDVLQLQQHDRGRKLADLLSRLEEGECVRNEQQLSNLANVSGSSANSKQTSLKRRFKNARRRRYRIINQQLQLRSVGIN